MTEFSVLMPLQGIAPGNSWLRGVSLKDYKIIWKIKIILWMKCTGMVKIKHKDFIDAVPIIPSLWIMPWGSMEVGGPRFPWVHSQGPMMAPLARIVDRQGTQVNPLLIIIMLFLLTASPQNLKLEKVDCALIFLFYVSPSSPPLRSSFKENAKILSKNSTTQENITIWRQSLLFY